MKRIGTAPEIHLDSELQFQKAVLELQRRRGDALRLYRPRPEQVPFHRSTSWERVVRGGNRAGKTVAAAAEVASAATGIPLCDDQGKELPYNYNTRKEPLIIWCIGYDEKHIGRMYRKLFKGGAFRIIKDRATKEWRAWRPWETDDAERENETKPSPPLIPPRMVAQTSFEKRGQDVFSRAQLKDGTEIYAFASGAIAGQGEAVDLLWIDEDIRNPGHVAEWEARLADRRGKLIWSAWPHSANDALLLLSERAKKDPDVFEVVLTLSDNPYIPADQKRKLLTAWAAKGEAVLRSRDKGEFTTDSILVFPSFNAGVHCLPSANHVPDELERFLEANAWQVPLDWTNYLSLDPGTIQPAVIFASVPPPSFGDRVVVWGEIYIPRLSADELAAEILRYAPGRDWEAFIIDFRAGRQTHAGMGVGMNTRQVYSAAFRRRNLRSRLTGSDFAYGLDDIMARNLIVNEWLGPQSDGYPKLRFSRDTTLSTQREFRLYKKRVLREDVKETVVDENNHAMDALSYLCAYGPRYVLLRDDERVRSPMLAMLRQIEAGPRGVDNDTVYLGAGVAPASRFVPSLS